MRNNSEAYQEGLALLEWLHGSHTGAELIKALKDVCPDFARMTIEWGMSGIMGRPGLDLITREYAVIACCVTLGHAAPQLRAHIDAALGLGATKQQIVELILSVTFYAGGAAVANALFVADDAFKARPEDVAGE